MIRAAKPDDLQQMVELGYRLCDQTPYARIPRDRPSIVRTFTMAMSGRFGCALVTEHEGKVSGILVGFAEELWFSKMRYATDLVWYAERPGAGLLLAKRFIEWAWKVPGVVEVTMGQSSGMKCMGPIMRRLGLQRVGQVWTAVRSPFARSELCQAS